MKSYDHKNCKQKEELYVAVKALHSLFSSTHSFERACLIISIRLNISVDETKRILTHNIII